MFANVSAKVSRNGLVGKAVCFSFCCIPFFILFFTSLSTQKSCTFRYQRAELSKQMKQSRMQYLKSSTNKNPARPITENLQAHTQ